MKGLSAISAAWARAVHDLPYIGTDKFTQAKAHLDSLTRGPLYWSSIMVIPEPGPVLADIKSARAAQQGKKRLHDRVQRGKAQYHQKRAYDCQRSGLLNRAILGETVTPFTMESITLSDGTQHHSVPEVHQGLSAHYADHFTPKGSQGTGLHAPGFDIQAVLHSKEAFLEATASLPIPASHRYLLDIIYDAISTQSAAMQAVAAELNTILATPQPSRKPRQP